MADGGPSRKGADPGVTLEIDVERHGGAWGETGLKHPMIERAARAAIHAAPPLPPGTYHVTIVLTDNAEMRALNRTWRDKDAATNVLSFPAGDEIGASGFLGDVVLAYETIAAEAAEQRIALTDHAAHLIVHGVLHLIGFDHTQEEDAERMEAIERAALASLGIADPYAEEGDQTEVPR